MIREINELELLSVYELMRQLRPHISSEQFVDLYRQASKTNQYTLYAYYEADHCIGLMGIRYMHDYVHQYHLYIDDLVVSETNRSKGTGAKLLKFAEELAQKKGCTGLRLCTGVENKAAMRFYERENWKSRAVVFKKTL